MKSNRLLAMLVVLAVLGMSGLVMAAEDGDKPARDRGQGGPGSRQRGEGGPGQQRRSQGGPGQYGRGGPGMMGEHGMMGGGMGMFERLGLTEKQRTKIDSIREKAMRKMMADIKKVLTDQQREQLEKASDGRVGPKGEKETDGRRPPGSGDVYSKLGLSKKQLGAMAEIRKDARTNMQEAETAEERRGIMQQMNESIKDILTDKQAEKLAQLQKQRQASQRGGDRGDREARGKGRRGRDQDND
ncbi:MAG: hypothetical protein KAT00_01755 [Planctomycetes bacterium]|nr:hypothetical protein [Planctomycetota bacterium]